ncbi:SRPBCC family protein [Streptomyces rectiviolaceus]|uniref:SRPBCC domain-containing protein n=1 Tax=Streptomyces rectiviolaceus TaxID=332591 RepID=A0ABP6N3M4_9ACTN
MTVTEHSLLRRALYVGPPLRTLRERYAKGGLVDADAPVVATCRIGVAAPPGVVWRLLSDLDNWPSWVPGVTRMRAGEPGAPRPGTEFRWKLNGMSIKSTMAVVDPEHELCWTGLLAGTRAVHRFRLTRLPDGGTEVYSEESIGGPLLALYYSSERLEQVLHDWLWALKKTAEETN